MPGWGLLRLLKLSPVSVALAVPTSLGLSLAIVSVVAFLGWMTGIGLRGVAIFVAVAAGATLVAAWVRRSRLTPIGPRGTLDAAAAGIAGVTALLAVLDGPWLSQDADSFYHLAAARGLLRTGDALPHDVFFGSAVQYPDATAGSLHDVLAWLSLAAGLIPAWDAFAIVGAAFTAVAFLAFAREITRSTPVALLATSLYLVLWLNLDMRTAGYPNRIGPGIVLVSLVFVMRYVNLDRRSWRELVPACALAFGAGLVHAGMAPLLIVLAGATLAAAAAAAIFKRRPLRSLVPLAIACAAVVIAVMPALVVRLLALPGPGLEGSFATAALAVKVRVLLGYPFVDFRFWFGGFITVTTVGTLCLLGRARRSLLDGDPGAALLWGGLLVVPVVCLTPILTGSSSYLYDFVRVAELLMPLGVITIAWELAALASVLLEIARAGNSGKHPPGRWIPAAALVVGTVYLAAAGLMSGALDIYFGKDQFTVAASRHNDLTVQWADRLAVLERARPGTVLADPDVSYELAGLTGRLVVAVPPSHTPFQVEPRDGILRRGDVADAFNPSSDAFVLASILLRYQVTYVLVDRVMDGQLTWDSFAAQRELMKVAGGSDWMLLRFDPEGLDAALQIPLNGSAGVAPSHVAAGRAAFARVASTGAGGAATITATGASSAAVYRAQFQVPAQLGATGTAGIVIPDFAPVDMYSVVVTLPGGGQVTAGQIQVGRTYEAESFAGVIDIYNGGYTRNPVWVTRYGSQFSRGAAVVAVKTSIAASHPLIDPLGDYCVAVRILGRGTRRTAILDVGMGDSKVELSWSDASDKAQELRGELRSTAGPRAVAFWVPAGGVIPITVDRVDLYPPPLGPATC